MIVSIWLRGHEHRAPGTLNLHDQIFSVQAAHAGGVHWTDILNICFDNREADVGRFVRRHLSGDLERLRAFFLNTDASNSGSITSEGAVEIGSPTIVTNLSDRTQPQKENGLEDLTSGLLDDGTARFKAALMSRPEAGEFVQNFDKGRWSIALAIRPASTSTTPSQEFLSKLDAANPRLTGWPVWLVSSGFTDTKSRPYVTEGGWQALIVSLQGWSKHVEFQRLVPKGELFLSRFLQDDLSGSIKPHLFLDPILMIYRVAEAIAVGLGFAKALGWSSETTRLGLQFEWSGLAGRRLDTWANPMVLTPSWSGPAHDAAVRTYVEVPLDTSLSAVAPYVQNATKDLFAAFDGTVFSSGVVEDHVRRIIERRLS